MLSAGASEADGQIAFPFRNKMRVREKTHVEYQVRVVGHAVPVPETYARNEDRVMAARLVFEAIGQVRTQLVNVELRSVDHHVGERAQGSQVPPLRRERGFHGGVGAERVRAASLAEAPQQ